MKIFEFFLVLVRGIRVFHSRWRQIHHNLKSVTPEACV